MSILQAAISEAKFSPCRTYRYSLTRHWGWNGHASCVMFIGLNPSTADETKNDPTIRRCINFAKSWGYDGLYMMNLFAFRATDPRDMAKATDPVGPGNDEALAYIRTRVGLIVAAWGAHKLAAERGKAVCQIIGKRIDCLAVNADGSPKHPLYVKGDTKPQLFWEARPQ